MVRTLHLLAGLTIASLFAQAADPLVYVGTYTRGGSRGIYAFRFESSGKLVPLGLAAETVQVARRRAGGRGAPEQRDRVAAQLARDRQQAERVLAISMFRTPVAGWADLVLPGTGYLERDGTYVNLEGRLQRLRRAVIPPCPDELAWISKLAERFDVELSPHPSQVFAELSERCYGGMDYPAIGELATLPERATDVDVPGAPKAPRRERGKGLQLVSYRPLFSGPAIERIPELQFQRPGAEIELSADDAKKIGAQAGSRVRVSSNGTSVELRARVNRKLLKGVARVAAEHAVGLGTHVEVST